VGERSGINSEQAGGIGGVEEGPVRFARATTQAGGSELVLGELADMSKIGVRRGGGRIGEEASTAGSNTGVEGVGAISDPRWQFKESPLSR